MLLRFDEGINAQQRNTYENSPFRSDFKELIAEYRLERDDVMLEVTDAVGESTKTPRLQQALQEIDKRSMRTSMSLGKATSIGAMQSTSRGPLRTGGFVSGPSLNQRAPS